MFSMEDYKDKRQLYVCAFTTDETIKDKVMHQLWVRALSREEAIGICMEFT